MKNITKLTEFKLSSNNTILVTQSLQQEVPKQLPREVYKNNNTGSVCSVVC